MSGQLIGEVIRHAPGAIAGAPIARSAGEVLQRDMRDGGSMRIAATVTVAGAPARRRVRLHEQNTGLLLRETWSNAETGAYAFDYIAPNRYFVIAFDHTGEFDPEAKADLQPEPMP